MERLEFKILIKAPAEQVWHVLWQDATYRDWTSVFADDSHAVSDWKEGSEIHFLDGKCGGMFSIIERKIVNEFISFKHFGEIKDGKKQPIDENSEWYGGVECYKLTEIEGQTELVAKTDVVDEFKDFMAEKFPPAMARIKELSELQGP